MGGRRIAHATLLVRDYDEAIAYYTGCLGLRLLEDRDMGGGKRWVVVGPSGPADSAGAGGEAGAEGAALLLARAATPAQAARIGDQAAGRVFLFLQTDDFTRDHQLMKSRGVTFTEEPRHESYGTVAVFRDLYGNLWDLLEPAAG